MVPEGKPKRFTQTFTGLKSYREFDTLCNSPPENYQYDGGWIKGEKGEITWILESEIPPPPPVVPVEILRFATREDAQQDPRVIEFLKTDDWGNRDGPVYKYGDKFYVQIYLGQHEWQIVNVDDPTDQYSDPGWEGTEYGVAVILGSFEVKWGEPIKEEPPERLEGKPITVDTLLFADREKLQDYLGEEDPLCPKHAAP